MKKAGRVLSIITLCALMLLMTACGEKRFAHGTISGTTYTSKFLDSLRIYFFYKLKGSRREPFFGLRLM